MNRRSKVNVMAAIAITMGMVNLCSAAGSSLSVDALSGYSWRGITFNEGFVIQPSIDTATDFGLGLNVWANMDIGDYDDSFESGEFSEVDMTVYYTLPLKDSPVGIDMGYVEYLYPHQGDTNGALGGWREVYVSLSANCILSPALTLYYEFDEVEDFYAQFALNQDLPTGKCPIGINIGASIGYAGEDFSETAAGGTKGGFADWNINATAGYTQNDALSYSLTLVYVGSLDEDVLPEQDVDFYGKLNVTYSF